MNDQSDTETHTHALETMMYLSRDGYVRLTPETLLATPLRHLLSGLDEDKAMPSHTGARLTRIAGYTEWVSSTTPILTLGWDWQLDGASSQVHYASLGTPRSNVMLVDAEQHDLGAARTLMLLETAIDTLAWQEAVHRHLSTRYA